MSEDCPKCGTPRERAESRGACPTCGLRLDRWSAFDDRPTPDPVLDPAFAALDWQNPQSHDSFLSLAQTAGLLDGAAARYRRETKDRPQHREQAERALAQLAILAVHAGKSSVPLGEGQLKLLRFTSLVVAFLLCVLVGVVLWRTLGRGLSGKVGFGYDLPQRSSATWRR